MKFSSVFCVIFIMSSAHYGFSLNCYECNSVYNKGCEDPMSSSIPSQNCSELGTKSNFPINFNSTKTGSTYSCLKFIAESQGVTLTVRQCQKDVICNEAESTQDTKIIHCSTCNTDNCNASTDLSVSLFLFGIMLAATAFKLT